MNALHDLTSRGIAALRAGDPVSARRWLTAALRANPNDAQAWLWIAGALPEPEAQRYCLKRVLSLEPGCAAAQQGLATLAQRAGESPQGLGSTAPEAAAQRHPVPPGNAPAAAPPPLETEAVATQARPVPPGNAPAAAPPPPETGYVNPWLTLWTRPRAAMRSAIAMRSAGETWLLAALAGISACMAWMAWGELGASLATGELLAVAVVVGPLMGMFALLIGGVLLRTGGWLLGGRAGAGRVRAALAWAAAPLILGLPLWLLQLLLVPEATFHNAPDARLELLATGGGLIHGALWVWSGWLSLVGLAEAHLTSLVRAAGAWVAAALVVVAALLTLFGGAALIISLRGG